MRYDEIVLKGHNTADNYYEVNMMLMFPDQPIYKISSTDGVEPILSREVAMRNAGKVGGLTFYEEGEQATWTIQFKTQLMFSEMAKFLERCLAEASWKEYMQA